MHDYKWEVYHRPSEIKSNLEDIVSELDKKHIQTKTNLAEMLLQISSWTDDGIQIHISEEVKFIVII